jgi:hypothetical protein
MEFENLIRIMKPACGSATAPSIIHVYFSNRIIGLNKPGNPKKLWAVSLDLFGPM